MFKLRFAQLQKQLAVLIDTSDNEQFREFAQTLVAYMFGSLQSNEFTQEHSLLASIYKTLGQIEELSLIFSRALSKLATEDPSEGTLYRLFSLVMFANTCINIFAYNPDGSQKEDQDSVTIYEQTLFDYKEHLRNLPKFKNQHLTSFESILAYLIDNAEKDFDRIYNLSSWYQILEYVFDIPVEQQYQKVEHLHESNIKELLLSYQYTGTLVSKIYTQYDALIGFSMGTLSMLTGHELDDEYHDDVNGILDSVGSTSRIITTKKKLKTNREARDLLFKELKSVEDTFITEMNNKQLGLDLDGVQSFIDQLKNVCHFNEEQVSFQKLEDVEGFRDLFRSAMMKPFRENIEAVWVKMSQNCDELYQILDTLSRYFSTVIRQANAIINSLVMKKFQENLPLEDVQVCERAGLRLGNIVSKTSTKKVSLPENIFEMKTNYSSEFDTFILKLDEFFKQKSYEEDLIKSLAESERYFKGMRDVMGFLIESLNSSGTINGHREEIIISCRILKSINQYFHVISTEIEPYRKMNLTKDNYTDFFDMINRIWPAYTNIQIVGNVALTINNITKNLWKLNKEFVVNIGLNQIYIEKPEYIEQMVDKLPEQIKTEYQQRYITETERDEYLALYKKIKTGVHELLKTSEEDRNLIFPY